MGDALAFPSPRFEMLSFIGERSRGDNNYTVLLKAMGLSEDEIRAIVGSAM
jgi:hypothetical protein